MSGTSHAGRPADRRDWRYDGILAAKVATVVRQVGGGLVVGVLFDVAVFPGASLVVVVVVVVVEVVEVEVEVEVEVVVVVGVR